MVQPSPLRILVTAIAISSWYAGYSQEAFSTLQQVTPPSPEAISFVQQNFSPVSLYTGKQTYSLPLYSLPISGIEFGISLNYTGGNGIKVEEVAASVGLGWSLQYTGSVTRVIKGMADDAYAGGYLHLPGIDSTFHDVTRPDHSIYDQGYSYGKYDGQPDVYYLSAPGISASFYINKYKRIVFIEKSDLVVTILWSGYTIVGFEVLDLSGNKYLFNTTEATRSVSLANGYSEYNAYDVSAWYLSEIRDKSGNLLVSLQYKDKELHQTSQFIRAPYQFDLNNQANFKEDESSYMWLYNKRPLLEKIQFSNGSVEFVMSQNVRCDLGNDRYIDSIKVRNAIGEYIRRINFDYSYFSDTGVVSEGEALPGDAALRLKLDSVHIIGREAGDRELYAFEYETDKLLPNRVETFAMDHWGYYNGKNNSTWEARYRAKYYVADGYVNNPKRMLKEFGSANREPDPAFAQACILKRVFTPLGGTVEFEYEGHTANHPELPNSVTTSILTYSLDDEKNYFDVDMIREPFAYVRVKALIHPGVELVYAIGDSLGNMDPILDTLRQESPEHSHKLVNGTYYIRAKVLMSHPEDSGYNYAPRLIRDIETLAINKPVGGVRIRRMKLSDPVGGQNLQRDYYYNESGSNDPLSLSTGTIGTIPKYGYQSVQVSLDMVIIQGYVRQLSTSYPLISTSGSYVGYDKVTVVDNDELKSESQFTTFQDFPELVDGYFGDALVASYLEPDRNIDPYDPMNSMTLIEGEWYEHWPFAPAVERDFYRGKITREVQYKREGSTFLPIFEKHYWYQHNFGFVSDQPGQPDGDDLPIESVTGMVCNMYRSPDDEGPGSARNRSKSFLLHTGRYDLRKTTERTYHYGPSGTNILMKETTFDYGHSPWLKDSLFHYQVTGTISTGSDFVVDSVTYYYPYDRHYLNGDVTPADTAHFADMEAQNRIGSPVIQKTTRDGAQVSMVKNRFGSFNDGHVELASISTRTGSGPLEDRFSFNRYDTLGNILEQQKTNDVASAYMWDYNGAYLVAEATNATFNDIAYTSFETGSKGKWIFNGTATEDPTSPTGKMCYPFNGFSIWIDDLNANQTYIVSYWKKGTGPVNIYTSTVSTGPTVNGWTYYEHRITPAGGTFTISGSSAYIDELRLYPETALMTTYTYEPLVGMTSQCDPNNVITRYAYDSFGRLTTVKDGDGNIMRHVRYHIHSEGQ